MGGKADIQQGTLALMVLKTLEAMGPLHGYGIARRIEQISDNLLSLNYGTLYPALLKLEQEGAILWNGESQRTIEGRNFTDLDVREKTTGERNTRVGEDNRNPSKSHGFTTVTTHSHAGSRREYSPVLHHRYCASESPSLSALFADLLIATDPLLLNFSQNIF
jgi:PadR family transcriptional regulator